MSLPQLHPTPPATTNQGGNTQKVFRTLQAGQITIVHMIDQHKQHHHHRQQDQHQQGEQHGHRSEDQGIRQDLNSQLDQLDKIEVVNKIDLQAQVNCSILWSGINLVGVFFNSLCFWAPAAAAYWKIHKMGSWGHWRAEATEGSASQERTCGQCLLDFLLFFHV